MLGGGRKLDLKKLRPYLEPGIPTAPEGKPSVPAPAPAPSYQEMRKSPLDSIRRYEGFFNKAIGAGEFEKARSLYARTQRLGALYSLDAEEDRIFAKILAAMAEKLDALKPEVAPSPTPIPMRRGAIPVAPGALGLGLQGLTVVNDSL